MALIRPGYWGVNVAADSRRCEFDIKNEQLVASVVRPDVVFIGDSITHFWELQAYFGDVWPTSINRGIGGDTSTYVRKRFAADVLQLKPRQAVLMIGTNDMCWCLEQLDDAITDTICENVSAMLREAAGAQVPVAVGSILPVWGPTWYPVPEFVVRKNLQIVEANLRLQQICGETGAVYMDYHGQMLDSEAKLRRELADDGVHPNAAGYAIMARALLERLGPDHR